MALLTKAKRISYLKDLGYDYENGGVLAIQKKYFADPDEWDNKWGKHTDALARHLHNVWKYTEDFKAEEFRCPCGNCTGYPTWMKSNELKNVQSIRSHFGKPMHVTSALRCGSWNSRCGGVKDSRHLEGRAVDFYMAGVTDTLARRKTAINWMRHLPKFHYAYCNGWNSYGRSVSRPSMGNAIHIDSDA